MVSKNVFSYIFQVVMVPKQAKDPKFSEPAVEVVVYKQTPDLNLLHLILNTAARLVIGMGFTSKPIFSGIGNSIKGTIRIKHLRKNLKMKTAATTSHWPRYLLTYISGLSYCEAICRSHR